MKSILMILLIIGMLTLLYFIGPKVPVDETIHTPNLPNDVEQYIQDSEKAVLDLKPNNEKKIFWARGRNQRTEFVILYFHGFSASRLEIEPVPQLLAERLGANLFCTRFTGHGRYRIDATKGVTVNDWLNDAVEALEIGKRLGNKIIILSTSTGGTLSAWLAQYEPESMHALLMISPNFMPADKNAIWLTRPWGQQLARITQGKERQWGDTYSNDPAWTNKYRTEFLFPMMGIVKHVQQFDYEQLHIPLLIFYSKNDQVVNPEYTKRVFSRWGTNYKRMIEILNVGDKQNHVLAGNIKSPENNEFVVSRSVQFISILQHTAWKQ